MKIYQRQGNVQLKGNLLINSLQLSKDNLYQTITNNIQWKQYISYQAGQICSCKKYVQDNSQYINQFFISKSDNNKNHNPSQDLQNEYWSTYSENIIKTDNKNIIGNGNNQFPISLNSSISVDTVCTNSLLVTGNNGKIASDLYDFNSINDNVFSNTSFDVDNSIVFNKQDKVYSMRVKIDNETLSVGENGLTSNLRLCKAKTPNSGYSSTYFLSYYETDDQTKKIGQEINVLPALYLKSASLYQAESDSQPDNWNGDTYIKQHRYFQLTFYVNENNIDTTVLYVDCSNLLSSYEIGNNAIYIQNNKIYLKIDQVNSEKIIVDNNSSSYALLNITDNGLSISHVQQAIDFSENNIKQQIYSLNSQNTSSISNLQSLISDNSSTLQININNVYSSLNSQISANSYQLNLLNKDQSYVGSIDYKISQFVQQNLSVPSKNTVSSNCYGNPLVIHQQYNVQNTQNDYTTVLLFQNSLNNSALGYDADRFDLYINKLSYDNESWLTGGLTFSNKSDSNYIGTSVQFSIQIKKDDLTNAYHSVLQHINANNKLCGLYINNNKIKFGIIEDDNCIQKQIQSQDDVLKLLIQYTYNIDNNIFDYVAKVYLLNNQDKLLLQYHNGQNGFFSNEQKSKFYFCQSISSFSRQNYIFGYNGKWRLLKLDTKLKNQQIQKTIGQIYSSNSVTNNSLTVDYVWNFSSNTDNAYVFGKIGNKNYLFRYPQLDIILDKLPIATKNTAGMVIAGNGVSIDSNGVISVQTTINSSSTTASYVDLSSYVGESNISIKSYQVSGTGTYSEIQSSNNHMYLSPNDQNYSKFINKNSKNGFYVNKNTTAFFANVNDDDLDSKIITNTTGAVANYNGSLDLYSYNGKLTFNGYESNGKNGFVILDSNGKIPNNLLNITVQDYTFNNRIVIYDTDNNQIEKSGIRAGNNINITYDGDTAFINAQYDRDGDVETWRQDQDVYLSSLDSNYIYVVKNIRLGCFCVADSQGVLIYLPQQQIENDVYVNFSQFVNIENGLNSNNHFTIKFIRGIKGNNGETTHDDVLTMIMSFLL